MTEDEMVGYHPLNGHEFERNPGDSKGQGSLECYSSWSNKVSDRAQPLNNDNKIKEAKVNNSLKKTLNCYLYHISEEYIKISHLPLII